MTSPNRAATGTEQAILWIDAKKHVIVPTALVVRDDVGIGSFV